MILIATALSLLTVALLVWPLVRAPRPALRRGAYDVTVYRAQLSEVDVDCAAGLIPAEQAELARLEIQRRLLAASSDTAGPGAADDRTGRRLAALVIVLVIPLSSALLYGALGHPTLPGRPYAERLAHEPAVILANAADEMERALFAHPSANGYRRLASLYLDMRNVAGAERAAERAVKLTPKDSAVWADLGQMRVIAGEGTVSPQALLAFAEALTLEPREPRARFYAGLSEAQTGHPAHAIALWRSLEADSKDDAPWLAPLRAQIQQTAAGSHLDPKTIAPQNDALTTILKALQPAAAP